jgi:Rad3-related DNA helicase
MSMDDTDTYTFPPPSEFGLPGTFSDWRQGQIDAVNRALDSPERFVCLSMPTGSGKSIVGMACARMSGLRTVYLTGTRGLQDQLASDFPEPYSVDIRGMQNYGCDMAVEMSMPRGTRVADGPCMSGMKCPLMQAGCGYFDTLRRAQTSNVVTTNYQMWFHNAGKLTVENGERIDLLVCDEGHSVLEELGLYLGTTLERKECLSLEVSWSPSGYSQSQWMEWAEYWTGKLGERLDVLGGEIRTIGGGGGNVAVHARLHEARMIRELKRKLDRVAGMKDEWVIEEQGRSGSDQYLSVQFDPLWPSRYAESLLFRGIGKVIVMSATLRAKSVSMLGVNEDNMLFWEAPSTFPKENRPVIWVPTVRMNHRTEQDDDQMMWFMRKIDLLLDARSDRKGVIHTVSYKRMRFIYDNSRHQGRMMIHGSDTRAHVIERFRRAAPGTVLLSPSVDTGYDFKGEMAEYQIICKLPFPDTRSGVMKARASQDKKYSDYLVAQTLQQMAGRVCRAEWDRGETLILDDNFVWWYPRAKEYLNKWFVESVSMGRQGKVPVPLDKL